jgi:hypothetical protein
MQKPSFSSGRFVHSPGRGPSGGPADIGWSATPIRKHRDYSAPEAPWFGPDYFLTKCITLTLNPGQPQLYEGRRNRPKASTPATTTRGG